MHASRFFFGGFPLDPLPSAGMFCRSRRGWIPPSGPTEQRYEATISAIENPPQAAARLPQPQLDQERAGHSAQSAPRRAQTAHSGLTIRRMALERRPYHYGEG